MYPGRRPPLFYSYFGEPAPKVAPALTKDAELRNAKVAKTMTGALQLATDAKPFLKTNPQKELLELIVGGLAAFFPSGFGTSDQKGVVVSNSTRMRYETMVEDPTTRILRPYLYDLRLFMTDEPSKTKGGQHRSIGTWASGIDLFVRNLVGARPNELVGTGIHEMIHMLRAMLRSFEARFGSVPTRRFPSSTLAATLSVDRFVNDRQKLEAHFTRLAKFLERDAGARFVDNMGSLIAGLAIEEVMAYVFSHRMEWAIAELDAKRMASKTKGVGVGITEMFMPTKFVNAYIRHHWFEDPGLQKSLQTPDAQRIINDMAPDLQSLTTAMETQIGP